MMRKLKLQVQISVDGYVGRPGGDHDWVTKLDDRAWSLLYEIADTSDTLLLGRKMAEGFVSHFESYAVDHPRYSFARKMVDIPKLIFSKTLDKTLDKNTSLAKGDLGEEIGRLKAQIGKDILVYGGAGFVSSLIAGRHIDEFYFFVSPVMIGRGLRIFDNLEVDQHLELVDTVPYECGVHVVHYRLKNGVKMDFNGPR